MEQAHETLQIGSTELRLGGLCQFQKEVGVPAPNLPGLGPPMFELFEAVLPDRLEHLESVRPSRRITAADQAGLK
jgi:hypothetical protein